MKLGIRLDNIEESLVDIVMSHGSASANDYLKKAEMQTWSFVKANSLLLQQRPIRWAIVGSGAMAVGIVLSCVREASEVLVVGRSATSVEHCLDQVRRQIRRAAERGQIHPAETSRQIACLRSATDVGKLSQSDVVIETVLEEIAVKQDLLVEIDTAATQASLVATNTSALDIDVIAEGTKKPERVLGLHFFNPAHRLRAVEIVRAAHTSDDTISTAVSLMYRLGKAPIVVGNAQSFVGNKMIDAYLREAEEIVQRVTSPAVIDNAMRAYGFAMGPFEMVDLVGTMLVWESVKRQYGGLPPIGHPSHLIGSLCKLGRQGKKSAAGWYRYPPQSKLPKPDPLVQDLIEDWQRRHCIKAETLEHEEIQDRLVCVLINEAAKLLQQGVAFRPSDIDVLFVNGYGFPAQKGGPMFVADQIGVPEVLRKLNEYHKKEGSRWKPATILSTIDSMGLSFQNLNNFPS